MQSNGSHVQMTGIIYALLTALCISIYTTIDGHAVKHTAPLAYGLMIFLLIPIAITPYVIKIYPSAIILQTWQANRIQLILISIISVVAYSLALFAYSLSPVSYAGAIREVSVVIGAFAGWKFLNEPMGRPRIIGAIIIFTGILIIALLG
jgi:drug/metabolite transporter (DMT)-like permease